MFLGSYQLGDRVPLAFSLRNEDGAPVRPDAAPQVSVRPASGAPVLVMAIPPTDLIAAPGLFLHGLHLDGRFETGYYTAVATWLESGASRASEPARFAVIPAGNAAGAVIAVYPFARPHAEFLVYQTDGRKLFKGRNPKVAA